MGSVKILGDGQIPEAAALYDVRNSLNLRQDITLLPHVAPVLGINISEGEVIYNMEPLHDGCRSFSVGYLEILKRCIVLDYSRKNVEYLKRLGIEAFYMSYGYHPSLERSNPADKDIDVLFIGSVNPRRSQVFSRLRKEVNFEWVQGVYEDERDKLISRAKVHINVHYSDVHPLEVVRLNYLMANGCNIVSEYGDDYETNEKYKGGLRFSRYEDIIDTCKKAVDFPVDGRDVLRKIPNDFRKAQEWLDGKVLT